MKFKDKLKAFRLEKGLTQQELADKAKVSRTALASWEQGYRSPKMNAVFRLAEVLNVNAIDILDDSNEMSFTAITKDDERVLIDTYNELNEEGKKMLLTFAQGLLYNPMYGSGRSVSAMADALYDGLKYQKALEDYTPDELKEMAQNEKKK